MNNDVLPRPMNLSEFTVTAFFTAKISAFFVEKIVAQMKYFKNARSKIKLFEITSIICYYLIES